MKAYYLLIIYYVILTIIILVNIPVAKHLRQYLYLGRLVRVLSFGYYIFLATILVLTHIFIFTQDWGKVIYLDDLLLK